MYLHSGRPVTVRCRCGNCAGKKKSPKTKQRVCKKCYNKDLFTKPKKKKVSKAVKAARKGLKETKPKYPVRKPRVLLPTYKGLEDTKAKEFCDNLRDHQTSAESRFKFLFGLLEIPIAPQYPIKREDCDSFYIVDFYMPTLNLVVEIDGEYHDEKEQRAKDKIRDAFLRSKGFKVLRFTNKQVFNIKTLKTLKSKLGM